MLSLEGKQLGNYDVIKCIRVGGMGAVYEGRQRTAFDRRVAIKVILGDHASDRAMQRRFAREAQTIARMQHPHILPLIEFGESQGILYLVMPFIDGGTLTSYLRHNLLDLEEVSNIYQQLLDAVEYAHDKGLIHRDIKSANVLLELRRNVSPHLYLADFGLVRTIQQNNTLQAGKPIPLDQVPGTPHYMAPEQTRGIVTPLTDIYALGVLLYQLLTGTLPYNDLDDVCVIQKHLQAPIPRPSAVDASIPSELDTVVSTAMAKHPEDRYCDIAELRVAFLRAIHGPNGARFHREVTPRRSVVSVFSQHTPERVYSSLFSNRKLPEPIIIGHRLHNENTLVAIRETRKRREKPGPTDSARDKVRMMEDLYLRQRQHRRRWLTTPSIFTLILVFLLIALLVSHGLGIDLIPSSKAFSATVYVTARTKTEENSYILTASTQQTTPDLATRTIPARILQDTVTSSRTVSNVAQADLDDMKASLQSTLEQQITQWFQKQLAPNEAMASQPSYKEETDPSVSVNGQADRVQVTVKVQGSVIVYNRATFEELASQLLSQHVAKELGKVYKPYGPVSVAGVLVQNGGNDGLIYLSVTVRGIWVYALTSAQTRQWQQAIKGTTSASAQAYLLRQPGVASVDIRLPFNTDHLPASVDQIKLVL